jgi:hypothetical protein
MGRQQGNGPKAVGLWTLLAASATATPIITPTDLMRMVDNSVKGVPAEVKNLFLSGTASNHTLSRCKVYPGDRNWPSDEAWANLNKLVDDRLLDRPNPLASVCYNGPLYNSEECGKVTAHWNESYSHFDNAVEMMSPVAQGMTCLPPNIFDSHNCTRGGFPMYVINATKPEHVQMGVNFARNTGVRLVVKNTGHDFLGKSGGKDALSIWTHYFKDIKYIEEYVDTAAGFSGPAFKAGVGVQAFEIYKAAHEKGHSIVGGEGETVGIFGGYIQGGGHSPLTSL